MPIGICRSDTVPSMCALPYFSLRLMVNRNALRSLYPATSLPTYGGSHSRPGSSRELPGSPPRRTACAHGTGKGWPSLTAPQDNAISYGTFQDYNYNIATNSHNVKYFFVNLNKPPPLPCHPTVVPKAAPGDRTVDARDSLDIPGEKIKNQPSRLASYPVVPGITRGTPRYG